jgi:hypothetical protein
MITIEFDTTGSQLSELVEQLGEMYPGRIAAIHIVTTGKGDDFKLILLATS